MNKTGAYIDIRNLTLKYELFHDRTNRLKEFIVNSVYRRSVVAVRRQEMMALKNLNLQIPMGTRLGILGHNGAGKSTLLKVISGILKPSEGEVVINGMIQPLIEISAGFNPEFSGRENIYFNGYMLGYSKKEIMTKEQAIIDFAELGDFINIPVKYYSSGMAVRLAFATATSINPDILLLDEMLSAGDVGFMRKAEARMHEIINSARIIVMVSHDVSLIQRMCTRVIVLEHGQIIFDGPSEQAIKFYLDRAAGEGAGRVGDQLHGEIANIL